MRSLAFLLLAGTIGVDALTLERPRDLAHPKVVQRDLYRNHVADPVKRDRARMRKRQSGGTVNVDLDNEESLYFMNVSIGTPSQMLRLHVDTGSSDLWVNTPSSRLCESNSDPCDQSGSGTYTANSSSTYQYINSRFNISYVDGSGSTGDYVSDTVQVADVSIPNQRFGIGYSSSSAEGILGIGYPIHEVSVVLYRERPYPNLPASLVNIGAISHNAYSLWLNDLNSQTGQILFGGVNTGKYVGQLETVPIIPENGLYQEFVIALTAVGDNNNPTSIGSNLRIAALLDSGSTLMYLPDDIASSIYSTMGARYDNRQSVAIIDCSARNSDSTIDFTFSGPVIKVPYNEIVIVGGVDSRGRAVCIVGILPTGGSTPVLGDTFLRSAYVVYDLGRNSISLAQTNFNSTENNIMEITNSTGVPDATIVPNAVTSVAVSEGGSRNGGVPRVSEAGVMPTAAPRMDMAALFGVAAGAGLVYAL